MTVDEKRDVDSLGIGLNTGNPILCESFHEQEGGS
jgi:hypothetical protein